MVVEEDEVGVVVVSDEALAKVQQEDAEVAEGAFTLVVEEEVDGRRLRVIVALKVMEESQKLPHLRWRS